MNATRHKHQPPPWVSEHLDATSYNDWLSSKAQNMCRRDRKRGGSYSIAEAKAAIHNAIVASGGRDYVTDEELRWDLLGNYDNEASGREGAAYKRARWMQPTVDHLNSLPVCDFVICSWRTNDAKGDMSVEELKEFCGLVLTNPRDRFTCPMPLG